MGDAVKMPDTAERLMRGLSSCACVKEGKEAGLVGGRRLIDVPVVLVVLFCSVMMAL